MKAKALIATVIAAGAVMLFALTRSDDSTQPASHSRTVGTVAPTGAPKAASDSSRTPKGEPAPAIAGTRPTIRSRPFREATTRTPEKQRALKLFHESLRTEYGEPMAMRVAQVAEDLCGEKQGTNSARANRDYSNPNLNKDLLEASRGFIHKFQRRLAKLGMTAEQQRKMRAGPLVDQWQAACPGYGDLASAEALRKDMLKNPAYVRLRKMSARYRELVAAGVDPKQAKQQATAEINAAAQVENGGANASQAPGMPP